MRKTLIVASSEFSTAVRSKAFIIGVLAMPVIMGIAIGAQIFMKDRGDTKDRTFAVIDGTGQLYQMIEEKAARRNQSQIDDASDASDHPRGPRFIPVKSSAGDSSLEALRLELSEKVRKEKLFAFLEIPGAALSIEKNTEAMRYYSDHPTYRALRDWLREIINDEIRRRRFLTNEIEQELVEKINRRVGIENLGLVSKKDESGEVEEAKKVDEIATFGVPAALMFLLFIVVMSSAPQLLNSVLEEKMSRISEVLLGSVTPFQLMMGKLIGSTWVSSLLAGIYIAGGVLVAVHYGVAGAISPGLFCWFLLFQVLAVFLFGSMFIAIGSACTEIKDTQTLMMPAMLLIMLPMFTWMRVLQSPDSTFSTAISLFPPATPMLMFLRIALHPGPPLWQVLLSVLLTVATVVACVWAAGKIFRTGILMQGKSASLRELFRWLRA